MQPCLARAQARSKMSQGTALTDADREPWLDRINAHAKALLALDGARGCVVACSALKAHYRERLAADLGAQAIFIHLHGSEALLAERLQKRAGHFMPATLLRSQLDTLEPPSPQLPTCLTLDIALDLEDKLRRAMKWIAQVQARL